MNWPACERLLTRIAVALEKIVSELYQQRIGKE